MPNPDLYAAAREGTLTSLDASLLTTESLTARNA